MGVPTEQAPMEKLCALASVAVGQKRRLQVPPWVKAIIRTLKEELPGGPHLETQRMLGTTGSWERIMSSPVPITSDESSEDAAHSPSHAALIWKTIWDTVGCPDKLGLPCYHEQPSPSLYDVVDQLMNSSIEPHHKGTIQNIVSVEMYKATVRLVFPEVTSLKWYELSFKPPREILGVTLELPLKSYPVDEPVECQDHGSMCDLLKAIAKIPEGHGPHAVIFAQEGNLKQEGNPAHRLEWEPGKRVKVVDGSFNTLMFKIMPPPHQVGSSVECPTLLLRSGVRIWDAARENLSVNFVGPVKLLQGGDFSSLLIKPQHPLQGGDSSSLLIKPQPRRFRHA